MRDRCWDKTGTRRDPDVYKFLKVNKLCLAERVGFEPTCRFRDKSLSRRSRSTTSVLLRRARCPRRTHRILVDPRTSCCKPAPPVTAAAPAASTHHSVIVAPGGSPGLGPASSAFYARASASAPVPRALSTPEPPAPPPAPRALSTPKPRASAPAPRALFTPQPRASLPAHSPLSNPRDLIPM